MCRGIADVQVKARILLDGLERNELNGIRMLDGRRDFSQVSDEEVITTLKRFPANRATQAS